MFVKLFSIMLVIIVSVLGVAACVPGIAGQTGAEVPLSEVEIATKQVQSTGELIVVDVTPMSDAELTAQPSGQSEPSAAVGNEGSQVESRPGAVQPKPGKTIVYADDAYKFSVAYPADFVFRTLPAEKLAELKPKPDAVFIFMNPVTASSDVVELEPADLEIRVYSMGRIPVLDNWLTSNGLLPADGTLPSKPFKTDNVTGVEVCTSTMIAPGCSYFFNGGGWVYQLTPATLEGEAMIGTFRLLP